MGHPGQFKSEDTQTDLRYYISLKVYDYSMAFYMIQTLSVIYSTR